MALAPVVVSGVTTTVTIMQITNAHSMVSRST